MIGSQGLASSAGRAFAAVGWRGVMGIGGALWLLSLSAAAAQTNAQRPSLRHFFESAEPPRLESAEQDRITSQKRDEAIQQLERIIAKTESKSPQKADLLYQLSELKLEKAKYFEHKETEK